MNKALIIVALTAIILVSGCVSEKPTVDINNGLQFNEFSADFTDMYDDESNSISMEVENVGGTTATDVIARLYGISSWTVTGDNPEELGNLDPPLISKEKSTRGGWANPQWIIQPPEFPQGSSATFEVKGRVRYTYSTSATSLIKVISKTQSDILRRKGELEEVPVATDNSYGPIKISVDTSSPIVVDENHTDKMMTIYVRNVGSGLPFDYSKDWPETNDLGKVKLKITSKTPQAEIKNCSGMEGDPADGGVVTLRRGYETAKIACTLVLDEDLVAGVPEETVTLAMTADYGYYIDKSVDIKVMSSK
jgi:hypothetical protein